MKSAVPHARRFGIGLIGCMVFVLAPGALWGASLVDVRLEAIDKPWSEQAVVNIYFDADESDLQLELRAFVRSVEGKVEAARALLSKQQDQRGAFLVQQKVAAPAEAGLVTTRLGVVFRELALKPEHSEIAFEVRGRQGEELLFAHATAWSPLVAPAAQSVLPGIVTEDRRRVPVVIAGKHGPDDTVDRKTMEVVEGGRASNTAAQRPGRANSPRPDLAKSMRQNEVESLQNTPWVPLSLVAGPQERLIYFATNRGAIDPKAKQPEFSTALATEVSQGACLVNIPLRTHHKGNLEAPVWFEKRDTAKHFLIESIQRLSDEQFASEVGSDDVLVFVHGFLNTFDDAVLRGAQLRYDIDFPGQVVCFSWPSAADINKYEDDGRQAAASTNALADLFKKLIQARGAKGAGKVHIFAHSMGNRVVLGAIYRLLSQEDIRASDKPFGQVVLAAPDVSAADFNYMADYVIDASQQVTYYFSQLDGALRVSQQRNSYQPIGLFPYFQRGLSTICADHTDMSFLGHTYYASSDLVLADLHLILTQGLPPESRMPPLADRDKIFGHTFWSFTPTTVKALGTALGQSPQGKSR